MRSLGHLLFPMRVFSANQTNIRNGTQKGKIYILTSRNEVKMQLSERRNNKRLWQFVNKGWKVLTPNK